MTFEEDRQRREAKFDAAQAEIRESFRPYMERVAAEREALMHRTLKEGGAWPPESVPPSIPTRPPRIYCSPPEGWRARYLNGDDPYENYTAAMGIHRCDRGSSEEAVVRVDAEWSEVFVTTPFLLTYKDAERLPTETTITIYRLLERLHGTRDIRLVNDELRVKLTDTGDKRRAVWQLENLLLAVSGCPDLVIRRNPAPQQRRATREELTSDYSAPLTATSEEWPGPPSKRVLDALPPTPRMYQDTPRSRVGWRLAVRISDGLIDAGLADAEVTQWWAREYAGHPLIELLFSDSTFDVAYVLGSADITLARQERDHARLNRAEALYAPQPVDRSTLYL